ncbi:putative PAS/PAC sensor hybrid histidine kinase [uncultured Desulfobacterium sp.]|uniref:histidine kinase n=1 Tax=uncultured Desulfobacterium sp. TaxID=201089 RepID=A0A445N3I5_9BACT|nr:putative PAS/PAC sensor hybrid histidine kinase [uncultured Desulfobacterium sp.]
MKLFKRIKGLRSKVVIILLAIVVLFISVEYAILRFSVFPGFEYLEHYEAAQDMKRVVGSIQREIYHLRTFCWDWSARDDTYDFAETRSKQYIESNLPNSVFKDNSINLFCLVNITGKVVWSQVYDIKRKKKIILSDFQQDAFPLSHPLISYDPEIKDRSKAGVSGVFMTAKGPMIIASCPILTSNNKGPARGFLIIGRFLNNNMIRPLVDQTQVSFDLSPISSDSLPKKEIDFSSAPNTTSPYWIEENSNNDLLIYAAYSDIKGNPALIIKAKFVKRISSKGHSTILYALVFMLLSTVALLSVMLFFLQRTVLGPISNLTRLALSIKETGDLSERISLDRNDEIGTLAIEFNRMLEKLEDWAAELTKANELLRHEIEIRGQTEGALRESEQRYRLFMQNFQGIAFQGPNPLAPAFIHGTIEKITGYTEAQMLSGEPGWDEIVHPDDVLYMKERVDHIMSVPNSFTQGEYRIIQNGGSIRWIYEVLSSNCIDSTKPIIIQGVRYDITEKKELERRLLQAQKMEAIGTLAGGVAHEFNNLLMTIVLSTEFALKKIQQDQPVCESLGMALEASYRARDLVEQILTFSSKESSELLPLTICPMVKEAIKIFRHSLPDSIEIESNIRAETAMAMTSPALINQILINLLSNASQAMGGNGGTLTVNLSEEVFNPNETTNHTDVGPEPYIKLSVSDTGRGMAPEIVEKIFEPFYTTKGPGEGTGMGLAVVHGIVRTLGGLIKVMTEQGKGTTFDVFLPMIKEDGSPKASLPAFKKGYGNIMVVDDDELLIDFIEKALEHYGYKVIGKTDSVEALKLFKHSENQIDLVITDLTMPQMTGMDLAKELLSIRPDIPIILCTGFFDHTIEEQSAAIGIKRVITKPLGVAGIVEAVYSTINIGQEARGDIS